MGNGVTVWNRKETEHGDYKTIAHIDPDRTVKFYDDSLPDAIKEQIQRFADTSEMTISATQDASVFSVPPAGKEPVLEAEPAAVPKPVTADEISDALIRWNGSFESKSRVNDYMLAHGRERGAAVWLKDEFGGADIFSVVTDHGALELPWAKVQRQLGILVNDGRFFTEADRMLAQAEQIAAQSAVAPYERFAVIETDEGYGIWDDLHDGLYVDEDGVTADFDSEWVAENYLLELKENHEAIVSAETFDLVQEQMAARKPGNNRYSGVHVFSGMVYCGDCGSRYGSKVWHANDKYRKIIWQCNRKYAGTICRSPHLTDPQIEDIVMRAMSRLSDERDAIIRTAVMLRDTIYDTSALCAEQECVERELADATDQLTQAVLRNANVALDQAEHQQEMTALSARYQELQDRNTALKVAIIDKDNRRKRTDSFIRELRSLPQHAEKFDPVAFRILVERITVYDDKRAVVRFNDGTEIEA